MPDTAVASGELLPIMDDAGAGVYTKGRNSARDFRVTVLGSLFQVGADGFTPRTGILCRTSTAPPEDLKVIPQGSPNQTVTIKKGRAVVNRTGQASYLFTNEVDQIVNMPAASAVNPRYDIICLAAYDKSTFVGDAAHGPNFHVFSGVVAGSPVVPATPTDMVKLADVLRAVNDNAIAVGEIIDKRRSTCLQGATRPLLPGDSVADVGLFIGELRYADLYGPEIWTGAGWKRISSKATTVRYFDAGNNQSFPDANSAFVQFRTATTVDTGLVAVSGTNNDTFTIVATGEYQVSAGISLASGSVIEFAIQVNGSNVATQTTALGTVNASTGLRLTAGDVIKVNCFQASGGARTVKTGFGSTTHIAIRAIDLG